MAAEALWLTIGLAAGGALAWWCRLRLDPRELSLVHRSGPPEEPCWTETVRGEDGLSYGRSHCHRGELAELEARARAGEFATPA